MFKICRPAMDKSLSQQIHCKIRARERLKIELNDLLYREILKVIKTRNDTDNVKVKYIRKQSSRVLIFSVLLEKENQEFNVCYDRYRHTLITILNENENEIIINTVEDVFGNRKSCKEIFGITSLKINKITFDILNCDYETFKKVLINNVIYYDLIEHNKRYVLKENILKEVMI